MNVGTLLLWLIILAFGIAVIWWLLSRLYQRSRSDVAFVRTGFLGRKVVISGGAFVIPGLHDVTGVNMNSVRIDIDRTGPAALITADRLRVDMLASFNVRVGRSVEDVSAAAQTFGKRTLHVDVLKNLLENSFVDALRAVAADMTLVELHQHRKDIGERISEIVAPSLARAGMELQSTSITKLDQTAREFFNPENAFDAAGLTSLTETIEDLRRRRHEVEQGTQISIEKRSLETERQRLEQERELVVQRSREESASAKAQGEIDLDTERSRLGYSQETEQIRVDFENQIEQFRSRAEQEREKVRIDTDRAIQEERAEAEKLLRQIEIDNARLIEVNEIERRKQVEVAEQKLKAEVAEQLKLVAETQTATEKAREELARAEEAAAGARDVARAEITRSVEMIGSQLQAETLSIIAEAETAAEKLRAAANEARLRSDAAGLKARNEAENLLSPEAQAMRIRLQLIDRLEAIIRESVRPIEKIDGLKIFDLRGAEALPGGRGASGGGGEGGGSGNLADQLVSAALRYRGQAPLVDSLLREVGLSGADLVNLEKSLPELASKAHGEAEDEPEDVDDDQDDDSDDDDEA